VPAQKLYVDPVRPGSLDPAAVSVAPLSEGARDR
jgi:hypothetical protein